MPRSAAPRPSRFLLAAALLAASVLASCGGKSGSPAAPATGPGPGPGPGTGSASDSARWATMEIAADLYFSLGGAPDRDAQTVAYLLAQDVVADAGVSDSLANVWACFDDGRIALFIANRIPTSPLAAERRRAQIQQMIQDRALAPPPFGTELPASNVARLMNSLEPRWHNSIPAISTMLSTSGYAPTAPASGLPQLLGVQGDGIFYWASHSGEGEDLQHVGITGIWTETHGDSVADKVSPIKDYWAAKELCYAWVEVQQPDLTLKKECHYAITEHWIRNRMSFSANSLVFIDACTSAKAELRNAFFAANAHAYCGWDALTSGSSYLTSEIFFDLLCGTDDVIPQYPRQRPFLFDWVRDWMIANGWNIDPVGGAKLYMNRNPAKATFGLLRPTIFRIFIHDTPADPLDYIEIEGDFGLDPGAANRSVNLNGTPMPGVVWSEHIITLPLPRTGANSHGDVTVTVRGHLSNVAQITRWVLPVTYQRFGPGSLQQEIRMDFILRGDASRYRPIPFATPTGFAHAISCSKASTGSYLMSGIDQPDPEHYTKWKGAGTLEAAKTPAELTAYGFISAQGNLDPGARRITTFFPRANVLYTVEKETGSTPTGAALVPFGPVTLSFDSTYTIKADSVGLSTSDGSAVLRWGSAAPTVPFNNGGR